MLIPKTALILQLAPSLPVSLLTNPQSLPSATSKKSQVCQPEALKNPKSSPQPPPCPNPQNPKKRTLRVTTPPLVTWKTSFQPTMVKVPTPKPFSWKSNFLKERISIFPKKWKIWKNREISTKIYLQILRIKIKKYRWMEKLIWLGLRLKVLYRTLELNIWMKYSNQRDLELWKIIMSRGYSKSKKSETPSTPKSSSKPRYKKTKTLSKKI